MQTANQPENTNKSNAALPSLGKLDDHQATPLHKVKKGEYIRLKPNGPVWIKGEFIRDGKKQYELQNADDINRFTWKNRNTTVYIGFTY